MKKKILFIQGGGNGGYEADAKLVMSLQAVLGAGYDVHYPRLHVEEAASDFGWCAQIGNEIKSIEGEVILVAHSLGASLLLKYFSENEVRKKISGIFLVSTPFWSGDEDWKKGLKLKKDFAGKLLKDIPIFFYQSRDDEEVPFRNVQTYAEKLPHATVREIANGGHQLGNDLTSVANDIRNL
jgi:predicted alpha/beta hydrolase family esterase